MPSTVHANAGTDKTIIAQSSAILRKTEREDPTKEWHDALSGDKREVYLQLIYIYIYIWDILVK